MEATAAVAAQGAAVVVVATLVVATVTTDRDDANSKGGASLDKCRLEDGSSSLDSIMDGQYDREIRRQNHICNQDVLP